MATVTFTQRWVYATADVACTECGRVSRRNLRDWFTLNPFNAHRDPAEIRRERQAMIDAEASKQVAAGRVCRRCQAQSLERAA